MPDENSLETVCRDCLRQLQSSLDRTRSRASKLLTLPEAVLWRSPSSEGRDVSSDESLLQDMYSATRDVCLTLESLVSGLEELSPTRESILGLIDGVYRSNFAAEVSQESLLDKESLGKSLAQTLAVVRQYTRFLSVEEHPDLRSSIREMARDIDLGRGWRSLSLMRLP